jgi:hypothetical protein
MRFREAHERDIPAICATFGERNSLPLEPRIRSALPALLRRLIASPAATVTVFEEDEQAEPRVVSFAGGVFLRDDFVAAYLGAPRPGLMAIVLGDLLEGRQPLLTLDEVRAANSGAGLTLAVFPVPLGFRSWNDPVNEHLRRLAPQAFVRGYAGYRLQAIYYEVFTDEVAEYLAVGGYRLLHDFNAAANAGALHAHSRPRMFRLARADLAPGAMSLATQMFDPPPARLGLTPAEQRVVLKALDAAPDTALAQSLGLSRETVRSYWRSIYQRLEWAVPAMRLGAADLEYAKRGLEKRRIAIEYFRQNMHELRPALPRSSRH